MAYNTSKGPRGLGDIKNEDDVDTQIDWDDDKITFKTNDVARVVIDNDHLSGSGALEIVGAVALGSTLNVSGTVTFAGGTEHAGGVVFNNDGADVDFRVESDSIPAMFYVDGGNSRVGIGLDSVRSPDALLEVLGVGGSSETMRLMHKGSIYGSANPFLSLNYANASTLSVYTDGENDFVFKANHEDLHIDTISGKNLLLQESGGKVGVGTTSPSSLLTVAGAISGSGAGSFGSLVLDGAANLQSAGITNAGAIAGATTIGASGNITTTGGFVSGSGYLAGLRLVVGNQTVINKQRNATFAEISASSVLQTAGATILGSTLDVSGALTFSGPASGSAAGAGSFLAVTPAGVVILDTPEGTAGAPGGSDTYVQFNNADSFGGSANLIWDDTNLKVTGNISGSGAGSFGSLVLDGAANLQSAGITNAGAVAGATTISGSGAMTIGSSVTATGAVSGSGVGSFGSLILDGGANLQSAGITNAGAIAGATTISGSGAGSFGSLVLDGGANLQSAGITNAGAIAGATTISGSGAMTIGTSITATGVVSGSGVGSFGSLILDGGANLQSAGITNAGAIAGATTVSATGNISTTGGAVSGSGQATFGNNLLMSGDQYVGGALNVSGASTFAGIATHEAHPVFETGITIKNADASAGYINFYEQSSNGTNVCTFRGKSSMGNCTITLPGQTGTVVLLDDTVTLTNKTLTSPTITTPTITGDIAAASDTVTFSSENATDPLVIIKNTTDDASGARLRFVKDKGAAGDDNDVVGVIEFYGDDDAQDQVLFAKIQAVVADASNGAEGGKLVMGVATHDGELQPGLLIADGDAEDEIDVTIGNGAASLTTIAGDMDLPNGCFALGSDASGDMYYRDGSGLLTRIAAGSDNHVLTLDGAVPGWEAAAGSPGGSDTYVQFNNAGSFGGSANLIWDDTNFKVVGALSASSQTTLGANLLMSGDQYVGGNLNVSGAQVVNRTAATTTYSVTTSDYYIGCNTNGGAFTVTLPATTGLEGRILRFKDEQGEAGTNTLTLSCSNAEAMDGQTTQVINTNYGSLTVICDGSNWFII